MGQKVPSLFTVMSTGNQATNPAVYSKDVNPFVLNKNSIVDVIINNYDGGLHPMRKSTNAPFSLSFLFLTLSFS